MQFPLCLQQVRLQNNSLPLFVPEKEAVREAFQKGLLLFPYWSQVWPAAKALAQFIFDHPEYTKDKQVVELGAGLGLPSLAAARHAKAVLCTDCIADAMEIAKQSAAHLRLQNFAAEVMDWRQLPAGLRADAWLLSDVNYEPAAFALLIKAIVSFLQKGAIVLLSTPQRLMAKEFISSLLMYCTQQKEISVTHEENTVLITVLVLQMQ